MLFWFSMELHYFTGTDDDLDIISKFQDAHGFQWMGGWTLRPGRGSDQSASELRF